MMDVGVCFESCGIFTTVNYGPTDVRTQGGGEATVKCWNPAKERQKRIKDEKEMVS